MVYGLMSLGRYADGSQYEGEYLDNQKHGTGEFLFDDGEVPQP